MKWSGDTLNSSSNGKTKFKLLRMLLKKQEKAYLKGLRRKSCKGELKRNSKKIYVMSFTSKKVRWLLSPAKKQTLRKNFYKSNNYKKLKSFN